MSSKYCSIECRKQAALISKRKYNAKEKKQRRDNIGDVIDLDGEIWKDINDFEGIYEISNKGRIKAAYRQGNRCRLLKPHLGKNGYYDVLLRNKEIKKKITIHRLLGLHFIENDDPINKYMIDHIDRNRTNNNLDNLRWVTPLENTLNR
jgi:hypothetical protein